MSLYRDAAAFQCRLNAFNVNLAVYHKIVTHHEYPAVNTGYSWQLLLAPPVSLMGWHGRSSVSKFGTLHGLSRLTPAFLPGSDGFGQGIAMGFSVSSDSGGQITHMQRNTEIMVVCAKGIQTRSVSKSFLILKPAPGFCTTLDVIVGEKTLGPFAGDFVDGVYEKDASHTRFGLGSAAEDDAGLHGRIIEQIRAEADDAFDEVGPYNLLSHGLFLFAEEHTVGKENGAASRLGLETLEDVLPEGVIGTALRRCAEEVAPPGIAGEGVAVPLLNGIGGIGEAQVELHEPVAMAQFGFGQGVAADHLKVLNAVEEQIHPGTIADAINLYISPDFVARRWRLRYIKHVTCSATSACVNTLSAVPALRQ